MGSSETSLPNSRCPRGQSSAAQHYTKRLGKLAVTKDSFVALKKVADG